MRPDQSQLGLRLDHGEGVRDDGRVGHGLSHDLARDHAVELQVVGVQSDPDLGAERCPVVDIDVDIDRRAAVLVDVDVRVVELGHSVDDELGVHDQVAVFVFVGDGQEVGEQLALVDQQIQLVGPELLQIVGADVEGGDVIVGRTLFQVTGRWAIEGHGQVAVLLDHQSVGQVTEATVLHVHQVDPGVVQGIAVDLSLELEPGRTVDHDAVGISVSAFHADVGQVTLDVQADQFFDHRDVEVRLEVDVAAGGHWDRTVEHGALVVDRALHQMVLDRDVRHDRVVRVEVVRAEDPGLEVRQSEQAVLVEADRAGRRIVGATDYGVLLIRHGDLHPDLVGLSGQAEGCGGDQGDQRGDCVTHLRLGEVRLSLRRGFI